MKRPVTDRDRQAFLDVATTLGDRICQQAEWQEEKCTWEIPVGEGPRVVQRQAGAFLYQGTAGIARFLLRLHGVVAEPRYLRTGRGAVAHAVALEKQAEVATDGYYSGTAGVASVCLELWRVTGEERWRQAALDLSRRIGEISGARGKLDLLAGEAGSLVGLLEIHQAIGEPSALETARRLGEVLVTAARRETEGVSWDTQRPAVFRNLLGLSHGAGGIALALLELFRQTGERRFFYCAAEALRYEDSFLADENASWPDMRCKRLAEYLVEGSVEELRQAVLSGSFSSGEPSTMEAWCHGAPGIGLARARFFAVTGRESSLATVRRAAELTRASLERRDWPNYSLCHGICGNAEILAKLAPHLEGGEERAWDTVLRAARRGVDEVHRRSGRWRTGFPDGTFSSDLMVGEAGVGLFYLRLASPELPSALLPEVCQRSGMEPRIDERLLPEDLSPEDLSPEDLLLEDLWSEAAEWARLRHFPRTTMALRSAGTDPSPHIYPSTRDFHRGLEQQVAELPPEAAQKARDALALESVAFELSSGPPDFTRSFLRTLAGQAERMDDLETRIVIAPTCRLFQTAYDWESLDGAPDLSNLERQPRTYLIHEVRDFYEIQPLSGLAEAMYLLLRKPVAVADLLDRLVADLVERQLLSSPDSPEVDGIRSRFMDRLKRACASGKIDVVEAHVLTPEDIDSELCSQCGECCHVRISIPADEVYGEFVQQMLEEPLRVHYPEARVYHLADGATPHVVLDLGDCRHLERRETPLGERVSCAIYTQRPRVCASFNCVSWWQEQRSRTSGRTAADALIEKVARLRDHSRPVGSPLPVLDATAAASPSAP